MLDLLQRVDGFVEVLAGLGKTQSVSKEQVENSSVLTFEGAEIRVSGLHNEVDLDAQKTRLQKLISEKENVHIIRNEYCRLFLRIHLPQTLAPGHLMSPQTISPEEFGLKPADDGLNLNQ